MFLTALDFPEPEPTGPTLGELHDRHLAKQAARDARRRHVRVGPAGRWDPESPTRGPRVETLMEMSKSADRQVAEDARQQMAGLRIDGRGTVTKAAKPRAPEAGHLEALAEMAASGNGILNRQIAEGARAELARLVGGYQAGQLQKAAAAGQAERAVRSLVASTRTRPAPTASSSATLTRGAAGPARMLDVLEKAVAARADNGKALRKARKKQAKSVTKRLRQLVKSLR